MKCSRFISALLALVMILALLPTAALAAEEGWLVPKSRNYAGQFWDVTGTWCESYVTTVCEAGLMEGRSDGSFNPSGELVPEHIVAICARLYNLLTGGDGVLPEPAKGQAWYDPAYEYLAESIDYRGTYDPASGGYLGGGVGAQTQEERPNTLRHNFNPGKYTVNRRSFLDLLNRTLAAAEADLPAINQITMVPDCGDPMALSFYNAGILNGSDEYGTFRGNESLNRGQAAAMLARVIDPARRLTFTLKSFDLCRDILDMDPDTVLLTVDGTEVTAALFANQLCTSLYQWEGISDKALDNSVRYWCYYSAPFQVMAEEKGISLSEEELAESAAYGQSQEGYLGLSAAYWQHQSESSKLNLKLINLYWEADWKRGEYDYHSDLEKLSESLLQKAVSSDALRSMDFGAVYARLSASPFASWNS